MGKGTDSQSSLERRRAPRTVIPAAATARGYGDQSQLYWLRDISPGGALLQDGPYQREGAVLQVRLHFPWSAPLLVGAKVVRVEPGEDGPAVAVAFNPALTPTEEIQAAITRTVEGARQTGAGVLIFQGRDEVVDPLTRNLHLLGRTPYTARTPLDAISWLQRHAHAADAVLVDIQGAGEMGLALLDLMANECPHVRRVAIARAEADDPWLQRLMSDPLTRDIVHTVLLSPWDPSAIARALESSEWQAA